MLGSAAGFWPAVPPFSSFSLFVADPKLVLGIDTSTQIPSAIDRFILSLSLSRSISRWLRLRNVIGYSEMIFDASPMSSPQLSIKLNIGLEIISDDE